MKASEIRSTFLRYFESKGHTVVASSPVVPGDVMHAEIERIGAFDMRVAREYTA